MDSAYILHAFTSSTVRLECAVLVCVMRAMLTYLSGGIHQSTVSSHHNKSLKCALPLCTVHGCLQIWHLLKEGHIHLCFICTSAKSIVMLIPWECTTFPTLKGFIWEFSTTLCWVLSIEIQTAWKMWFWDRSYNVSIIHLHDGQNHLTGNDSDYPKCYVYTVHITCIKRV